jgi:hypothetical protein
MEVHAPHEKVHTWRDFFVHVGIMTIGLFIALMLEGLVEYSHHRHIVREARENIRQEIEDNHESAQKDLVSLQQDMDRIKANLDTIRRLRDHPRDFHGSLTYTMQFNSMESAAWDTSRDTGALSYMPYKDVQAYADLYEDQKLVNDQAIEIFHRQTLAMTPVFMEKDFTTVAPNEVQEMLHESAATLTSLDTLKQIVQQLDDRYLKALQKP